MEILDLIWKMQINREFVTIYGSSGYEMEFLNLKWKLQISYGNSRYDLEIMDYIRKLWILNGNSGSEMEIQDKMEIILLICMEIQILGPIFQIFRILADLPSKLLTSLLYVFRP